MAFPSNLYLKLNNRENIIVNYKLIDMAINLKII